MVNFNALVMALGTSATLVSAADFQYRFYRPATCNHGTAAALTFPRNDGAPGQGNINQCYSAPTGTNWQRLEIDNDFSRSGNAVITYCNVNCQGSGSALQKNKYCYEPFSGCAIGSL
ncbi:hypothetical protein QBC34DRAFT_471948 [Podospora aff. communis PSN243]|uniref:Cyanovirin-N domain-containing protein n=1 Tax=Podospora aff. communis PSN243 TaxID=3040156 RepID=A0AAV9GBG4_9PEZI|nr:hypothetical protein QBC34DRAFT_471948 [Podospora aff. communis PSN243]